MNKIINRAIIRLEVGKNNNLLLQLKVSCFQLSGKMILFYWKYSNMTHITISNYFKDFTNLLISTFIIWKQVLFNNSLTTFTL